MYFIVSTYFSYGLQTNCYSDLLWEWLPKQSFKVWCTWLTGVSLFIKYGPTIKKIRSANLCTMVQQNSFKSCARVASLLCRSQTLTVCRSSVGKVRAVEVTRSLVFWLYLFVFSLREGKLHGGHSQLVGEEIHISRQLQRADVGSWAVPAPNATQQLSLREKWKRNTVRWVDFMGKKEWWGRILLILLQ